MSADELNRTDSQCRSHRRSSAVPFVPARRLKLRPLVGIMFPMDTTRNFSAGAETTQAIPASGVDPGRTVIGTPAFDPGRTAMGAPGGLALQVVAGNRYAMATETGREHALVQLQSSGMMAGRRLPLNLCLVIDRS